MQSQLYSLVKSDYVKGLIVAVIGAVLVAVEQAITNGGFSAINWGNVATLAVTAGISYLIKNFFSSSDGNGNTKVFGVKV